MFKAWIGFKRDVGMIYSNPENSFKDIFDTEFLHQLLSAFDKDEVKVHGEVKPEDPLQFYVQWVEMDGEELDLPEAITIARYLRLKVSSNVLPNVIDVKETK